MVIKFAARGNSYHFSTWPSFLLVSVLMLHVRHFKFWHCTHPRIQFLIQLQFNMKFLSTLLCFQDMASAAFIEPLPVVECAAQLLGKDLLSRQLSDADRIKVLYKHSLFKPFFLMLMMYNLGSYYKMVNKRARVVIFSSWYCPTIMS